MLDMRISKKGIDLAKRFSAYSQRAYKSKSNVWTIGYGTVKYYDGKPVRFGDRITTQEAHIVLERQLNDVAYRLTTDLRLTLNQNQYDALACYYHDLEEARRVEFCNKLKAFYAIHDFDSIARLIRMDTTLYGERRTNLVRRRKAEADLFLKSDAYFIRR